MPTSRSRKRDADPSPGAASRFVRPFVGIVLLAVLAVGVIAPPASLVRRALPATVGADDFSGSLWHGSAGRMTVNGRDAGGVEWRIHPATLLRGRLTADVHWVKVAFVADGKVDLDRDGVTLHDFEGDGPVEDLADLGVARGWRGAVSFKFTAFTGVFRNGTAALTAAVGDVSVAKLASPQVAGGVDLGGYVLHLADGAITPGGDATAELADTGGPLELNAVIHFSIHDHTGLMSGTIKERVAAPPALRNEIANLAQLHARDAQGRIPVDLEFTL